MKKLGAHGINIHFISNSSTSMIQGRLRELFGSENMPLAGISVQSDAAKFRICELSWDEQDAIPKKVQANFLSLSAAYGDILLEDINRPIYLRRGSYFEAICQVFKYDLNRLSTSVFCGDIWEMDLAMPYALGANVHLLERAEPFPTYAYERQAIAVYGPRAKISTNLSDLLEWL